MASPHKITVRAYQVGFGDCFLLTFHYRRGNDRHVLIDFGSTGVPRGFVSADQMLEVAKSIEQESGGKVHVVVATHRHKDHISGFETRKGKGPGDIIARLDPDLVVQPWTEDPDAAPNARVATTGLSSNTRGRHAFVRALHDMHGVAEAIRDEALRRARLAGLKNPLAPITKKIKVEKSEMAEGEPVSEYDSEDGAATLSATVPGRKRIGQQLVNRLAFMGDNNLANRSAIENLNGMGKKHAYVHYGSRLPLARILPGVKVRVLGPPTLEQSETILKQRQRDENEFWQFQAAAGRLLTRNASNLFPEAAVFAAADRPRSSRWLLEQMQGIRGEQLLEIVRILDQALNNTSVILLFEVGQEKLLFPGDAQIENWLYALTGEDGEEVRQLLSQVTFYKVGHHGSLNATPKSLWNGFSHRGPDGQSARLCTLVSTMTGKHGDSRRETEVPRKTLIEALKNQSAHLSTQQITKEYIKKEGRLFLSHEIEIR